jgi:LCP family protein required for cell wall assembly
MQKEIQLDKQVIGEVAGRSRKKIILGLLAGLLGIASVCAAAGFVYVKYIETRLHKGEKGLEKVISNPIGDEPVNFLLLGSDARGKERARTDTIILLHLDNQKKKAIMVSIPRDMRVKIPGRSYDKINAAHSYGGPELIVRTVEDFTGFSIHHYVETDFTGFQKMVDALGGVEIYLDKPMKDKMSGANFSSGNNTLNGAQALAFVRSRRSPRGDFDRVANQQKFLKALYSEAKAPASLTKLPQLINIFADNTVTDLSASELLSFASLIRSIPEENIETITLEGTCQRIKGVSYVIPDDEKNREILERVKDGKSVDGGVLSYTEVSPKMVSVEILNGCGQTGLAKEIENKLEKLGFKVATIGEADSWGYSTTKILYRKGEINKARCVAEHFPGAKLGTSSTIDDKIDVRVIVGTDYKKKMSGQ